MSNPHMRNNTISICHGQNCHGAGGKVLAEALKAMHIPFKMMPCQSLCPHAPVGKIDNIAILHADIEKLTAL